MMQFWWTGHCDTFNRRNCSAFQL